MVGKRIESKWKTKALIKYLMASKEGIGGVKMIGIEVNWRFAAAKPEVFKGVVPKNFAWKIREENAKKCQS